MYIYYSTYILLEWLSIIYNFPQPIWLLLTSFCPVIASSHLLLVNQSPSRCSGCRTVRVFNSHIDHWMTIQWPWPWMTTKCHMEWMRLPPSPLPPPPCAGTFIKVLVSTASISPSCRLFEDQRKERFRLWLWGYHHGQQDVASNTYILHAYSVPQGVTHVLNMFAQLVFTTWTLMPSLSLFPIEGTEAGSKVTANLRQCWQVAAGSVSLGPGL